MFKNHEIRVRLAKTPKAPSAARILVEEPNYSPNDIAIVVKDVIRYATIAAASLMALGIAGNAIETQLENRKTK